MLPKIFEQTKNIVLDILFPKYCVNCGQEGDWLCLKCARDIVPVVSQVCPKCGRLSGNGRFCKPCRLIKLPKAKGEKRNRVEMMKLNGVICAAYFEEGPIREMIHNFKYNGVLELGDKLAEMMARALNNELRIMNNGEKKLHNSYFVIHSSARKFSAENYNSILTFVPLHWHRQAQRGYNQSEILAKKISEKLNIEVENLLIKTHATKRQVELQGNRRRKNLSGVFVAKPGIDIKKKKIIIVDDITTTGSTLNECARVLKKSGAREVWGLVIARGKFRRGIDI